MDLCLFFLSLDFWGGSSGGFLFVCLLGFLGRRVFFKGGL